ncbi:ATP-binding cassette domain-containing protein [Alloalcanivorax xenomutans]|uniref:ATP-binding cassette domain-containing protein n=1 Tax=Alloalcanivorax xenomutans TaxID=1094342 RepID=UPI0024E1D43C|nr:ATP-binding cassette domain-containing protein [Alloalcanivorax xenomutans]
MSALTIRNLTKTYGNGVQALKGIDLTVEKGEFFALLGPNGAGKSTLIKTLVGDLPLLSGDMTKGQHLKIGYFAQHQLEALDLQASALLHIQRLSAKATEQEIRNFLGGFNFHGDKALEPVAPFSGGEKARLALALVVWQKPNLLLLDEPTNHLDLEMRHALTVALQTYQGALVVISHDRHLLRNTVDEYWLVSDGKVQTYDGTLDDYYQWLRRGAPVESDEAETQKNSTEASPTPRLDKKAQRQQAAAARAQIRPLRNKVQKLETAVETGQQKLAEVDAQLADPALYESDDKTPLQDLLTRQGQLQKELEANEEQWLHLLDELEQLEQGRQTG